MNAPMVRIDRGRDYATVHGERGPGDAHANVHFYQDGLPFDSHGFLIADHPELNRDDPRSKKLRALADRKLTEAAKRQSRVPVSDDSEPNGGDPDEDGEGDRDNDPPSVNLEAWLRGEEDHMWHILTQTIAQRYKRRVSNLADAVTFLVSEKVVPASEVAKKYQKHLA